MTLLEEKDVFNYPFGPITNFSSKGIKLIIGTHKSGMLRLQCCCAIELFLSQSDSIYSLYLPHSLSNRIEAFEMNQVSTIVIAYKLNLT